MSLHIKGFVIKIVGLEKVCWMVKTSTLFNLDRSMEASSVCNGEGKFIDNIQALYMQIKYPQRLSQKCLMPWIIVEMKGTILAHRT